MSGVTVWFDFDIAKYTHNPFFAETPFGEPCVIGKGNVFDKSDRLAEALRDACERLETAGFPAEDLELILENNQ